MDDEEDNSFISEEEATPREYSGSILGSGRTQSFACPNCGSYNTSQGTYFEQCNTCGWSQGY